MAADYFFILVLGAIVFGFLGYFLVQMISQAFNLIKTNMMPILLFLTVFFFLKYIIGGVNLI